MAANRHILEKVTLDLTLGKEEGHYKLQERWANILKKKAVPALSDLFDGIVPESEVWRVDRLVVDLGQLDERMSDREIAGAIVEQVRRSYENYRTAANGHFNKMPVMLAEMEALVFFLINGHLPPGAMDMDVEEVFYKSVNENFESFLELIKRQLGGAAVLLERVAKRMAWQFSEKDLWFFLKKIISQKKYNRLKELPVFFEKIKLIKNSFTRLLTEQFWIVFLKLFFNKKINIQNIEKLFFAKYTDVIKKINIDEITAKKIMENMPEEVAGKYEVDFLNEKKIIQKEAKNKEGKKKRTEGEKNIETLKGIFCKNAGVVLLHPFLPGFFKNMSLLAKDGKSFLNKEKRKSRIHFGKEVAVHWLHYLATGEEKAGEQDLAFAKFLCGIKIAEPIKPIAPLETELKEEAEKMLQAVITHWKALKSTSPNGLREGFLQRQGRLTQKSNGHLLELENKAQDILLGKLPWGMSIIHFPWMEKPLWVEWG